MAATISGSTNIGITLTTPVTITTSGRVEVTGTGAAVSDFIAPGTLVNYGQVRAVLTAVDLSQGGLLLNHAGATVYGLAGVMLGAAGSVDNAGSIGGGGLGVGGTALVLTNEIGGRISGGVSANSGHIANMGSIIGMIGDVVDLSAGGTVSNLGSKAMVGGLDVVGVAIGGAGLVVNQGTIDGVSIAGGGGVTNQGYIALGAALYAVNISGGGNDYVKNTGVVAGIGLADGGDVVNQAGGLISGNYTGVSLGTAGDVTNRGTIFGLGNLAGELNPGKLGGAGVALAAGAGLISNLAGGLIAGTKYGVLLSGTDPDQLVVNYGAISGRIGIRDFGSLNNTIVDYGTIIGTGGVAVEFGSGDDLLLLKPGAVLAGAVEGGSGTATDTVDFSSSPVPGSINWIGQDFVGDVTFVNTAPMLSINGSNTITPGEQFANATTLVNAGTLQVFGELENYGSISGRITLGDKYTHQIAHVTPGVLDNFAGAVITSTLATVISVLPGYYPTTIDNDGTIEDLSPGGVAISFSAGQQNLLRLTPGQKIIGAVNGGSPTGLNGSILELAVGAGAGSIGQGGSVFNFSTVMVDGGAVWNVDDLTANVLDNDGIIILDPTTMTVDGTLAGSGVTEIGRGSELIINGAVDPSATIAFTGADATLALSNPAQFKGQLYGFSAGQTIDLTGLSFSSDGRAFLDGTALAVLTGGSYALIPLANNATDYFHLSSDGASGTDVTELSVPCFLAGTMIRTPGGDVPVQALRAGDMVSGADGSVLPVKWIGRRRYSAPLPDSPDLVPVLIRAGALADGVPDQDLYISPLHAVGVERFLVPAGALLNDVSVRACTGITEIEYFHIETEEHSIILANNTPAETFIDQDSRAMFDNAEEYNRLFPFTARHSYTLCAPRLEYGPELERLRRQVALRAGVVAGGAQAAVVGFLEIADRQTIAGWAYAPGQPNVPVRLEIFNRGALLARTIANMPRGDVKTAGFGHGRAGFSISLPAPLPALMRHEISVRAVGMATPLPGSPVVIDPAIAHDLLKSGGLRVLLDAAVQGSGSAGEIESLGNSLEAFARQMRLRAATPVKTTAPKRGGPRPVVLMLDEHWPTVALDAGSNAIVSHITAFQQLGYEVHFCASGGPPQSAAAFAGLAELQAMGVDCFGQNGAAAEDVIRRSAAGGVSVIYLHRLAVAAAYGGLARQYAPAARLIYALADLHHVRLARQAEVTGRPDLAARAKAVKATEFWAMQLADCVITHSTAEAAYLRAQAPMINVHVVPWTVPVAAPLANGPRRQHVAFIGGAGHAPNVDAVQHLARDIMPLVWAREPGIRCLVAGDGWAENFFSKLDLRIVNLGHQTSLAPLLQLVKLTVAPLRFGAGLKGKVLESLAAGTACIMSNVAAEGLPLDGALSGLVGDGQHFADNLLAVYGNRKTNRVAVQAGLDMVETYFNAAAVKARLAAALGVREAAAQRCEVMS